MPLLLGLFLWLKRLYFKGLFCDDFVAKNLLLFEILNTLFFHGFRLFFVNNKGKAELQAVFECEALRSELEIHENGLEIDYFGLKKPFYKRDFGGFDVVLSEFC